MTSTRSCQGGPKPSHPLEIGEDEQPPPHPHSPAGGVSFFAAFIRLQIAFFFFFPLQKSMQLTGAGLQQQQRKGGWGKIRTVFWDIPIPCQEQGQTDPGL